METQAALDNQLSIGHLQMHTCADRRGKEMASMSETNSEDQRNMKNAISASFAQ